MRRKTKKRLFIYGGIFLLLVLAFVAFLFLRKSSSEYSSTGAGNQAGASGASNIGGSGSSGSSGAGTTSSAKQTQTVPLSQEEVQIFSQALLSSEFLKALPEKYPIQITFFDFQNGERRWRSRFLFNNKGFLSSGEPEISITLHAKYIPELSNENFCDIVQKAKKAGDLGFYSETGTVSLLLKYAGMLKYRSCFGF